MHLEAADAVCLRPWGPARLRLLKRVLLLVLRPGPAQLAHFLLPLHLHLHRLHRSLLHLH